MNYISIKPRFWQGGTGCKILKELGGEGGLLAFYFMTNPHVNQSGVYFCPINYIMAETNSSRETIETSLCGLEKLGFLKYDYDAEVVWVRNLVKYQVDNWPNQKNDKRYKGVINAITSVPDTYLKEEFFEFWKIEYYSEGASSTGSTVGPLRRGLEGASKGLKEDIEFSTGGAA
ncbi:MAG: hypothetical protein AB2598_09290 [Candidatus Thiodiazotropha sp.]